MYLAQELTDALGNLNAHSCLSVPLRSLSVCVWSWDGKARVGGLVVVWGTQSGTACLSCVMCGGCRDLA